MLQQLRSEIGTWLPSPGQSTAESQSPVVTFALQNRDAVGHCDPITVLA